MFACLTSSDEGVSYRNSSSGITSQSIDYSHIVLIIAIWPGDRIRRPEHSTVERGSCDESV